MSESGGTVAELLLGHAEQRSTGVLSISRGQARRQLFLRQGALVSAESNLREEALGEVMVSLGLVSRERLGDLLTEVKRRGQKMGTVLLTLGWVSPDQVLGALKEQVRRRALGGLRAPREEASFEATSAFVGHVIEHRFELPPLIWGGLRETSTLELLTPLLDRTTRQQVRLAPRFGSLRDDFQATFGAELPDLLEGGCELDDLVLRQDGAELVYGLEALLVTGLAVVEPVAEGTGVAKGAATTSSPGAAARSGGAAPSARPGQKESRLPLSEPGRELFGEVRTGASAERPPAAGGPPPLPPEVMREYLEMFDRNPHELLGVNPGASRSELDAALGRKRARLVELAADQSPEHRAQLGELLDAYARAHATLDKLGIPTLRDSGESPQVVARPSADPLGAELAFGEGHALLAAGRIAEAIPHLRRAVERRPDQASYHAFLGWALYRVHAAAAMPEALDRLEHAVAVDPDSADAHALLGGLLSVLGDGGRARAHLERTLILRPEQPDSIELLARMYVETGEPEHAEKLYRRVLAALGERELRLRTTLWRELGELYEGPLCDVGAAARAYSVAAALDPDDPVLAERVAHLAATAKL